MRLPLVGLLVLLAAAQVLLSKCPGEADVIIVLDSSTSVGPDNWKLQLEFVKNLLAPLTIGGSKGDRVAFITYNENVKLEFNLDKYSTLADLNKAISSTEFSEGVTATGDALKLAREQVLPKARKGVTKLVFLVTDGKTNWGADPIEESKKLKKLGAKIITVGITSEIDKKALTTISSTNEVNSVSDFSQLSTLINSLQKKTCETKKKCDPKSKSEVIIVLDSSTSVGKTDWQLELDFVNNLVAPFNIGPTGDRVAFITYNTNAKLIFGLKKYTTEAQVANAVKAAEFSEGITATGSALQLARTAVLPDARSKIAKILILVTDGETNWGPNPIAEAKKLKDLGVNIITVGITSSINEAALKKISSNGKVEKVDSFAKLSSLIASLGKQACAVALKVYR